MKKIKVYGVSQIEEELESLGATHKQARVIAGVMRGIAGDILNDRVSDEIRFATNGKLYKLILTKE